MPQSLELSAKVPEVLHPALSRIKSVKSRSILTEQIEEILELKDPHERQLCELLLLGALNYVFKMGQVCLEDYQMLRAIGHWSKSRP